MHARIYLIASLLFSFTALAAPPERHLVFRPDQIDVERLGPLVDPIRVLRPVDTGSLIQVRTSFAREIRPVGRDSVAGGATRPAR